MKFDQDLCLNLRHDFGKMNSTLGSVVPLAMFPMFSVNEESPISESVSGCVPHTITVLLHHFPSNSMRGYPPEEKKLACNTKVRTTITNVVLTQSR